MATHSITVNLTVEVSPSGDNPEETKETTTTAASETWAQARLTAEAVAYTAMSLCIMRQLEPAYGGILSLLLSAGGLRRRLSKVLQRHRECLWIPGPRGYRAIWQVASSYLVVFLAIFFTYCLVALYLGSDGTRTSFGFALEVAGIDGETLWTRRFGAFDELLAHNWTVFLCVLCISIIFRSFGAILALGWNAAVWSVALTELARTGVDDVGGSDTLWVANAFLAIIPHVLLEAVGYVLAALAGISMSVAMRKYRVGDLRLWRAARASMVMGLVGFVTLVLAALVESNYAPAALGLFAR